MSYFPVLERVLSKLEPCRKCCLWSPSSTEKPCRARRTLPVRTRPPRNRTHGQEWGTHFPRRASGSTGSVALGVKSPLGGRAPSARTRQLTSQAWEGISHACVHSRAALCCAARSRPARVRVRRHHCLSCRCLPAFAQDPWRPRGRPPPEGRPVQLRGQRPAAVRLLRPDPVLLPPCRPVSAAYVEGPGALHAERQEGSHAQG